MRLISSRTTSSLRRRPFIPIEKQFGLDIWRTINSRPAFPYTTSTQQTKSLKVGQPESFCTLLFAHFPPSRFCPSETLVSYSIITMARVPLSHVVAIFLLGCFAMCSWFVIFSFPTRSSTVSSSQPSPLHDYFRLPKLYFSTLPWKSLYR